MSDERYQQRQQKLKEHVDGRVAAAQKTGGVLMVFTGNGKGNLLRPLVPRPAPPDTV